MRALVIGAGVAGSMAAHYLSSEGLKVTLVDWRPLAGVNSSIYNAGSLDEHPSFTEVRPIRAALASMIGRYSPVGVSPTVLLRKARWIARALRVDRRLRDPLEERLLRRSLALWDRLVAESPSLGYYSRIGLRLYGDVRSAEREARRTGGRLLGRGELLELGFSGFEAGVEQESRWINPHVVMDEISRMLREDGVEVLRAEARLRASAPGVVGVADPLPGADVYVVAAGAWTDEVCRGVGCSLGIEPARGVVVLAEREGTVPGLPALLEGLGAVVAPHLGRALRITGYFELVGYDANVDRRARALLSAVGGRLRAGPLRPVEVGAGMRPCSYDQLPVVGKVPGYENLFVATGGCRRGMTMAPLMARALVDAVMGRDLDEDLRALSPSRLMEGRAPLRPRASAVS